MIKVDIEKVAKIAKEKNALLIVDNTLLTPLRQKPLTMGADIVVHSATKYLTGHNDILAGAVITNDEQIGERLAWISNTTGAVLSAFDSWLFIRSLKTLPLRFNQQEKNAMKLAEELEKNPNVKEVLISGGDYPRNLSFLIKKPISLVSQDFFDKSLKVVVDTSTKNRIFDKRVIPEKSLKFDHHPEEEKWLFEIGGDYWPATGQLLTLLIKTLNLKVNETTLEGLAVAIITDTEYFSERNISAETFDMMSFLMSKGLKYSELLAKMQLNKNEAQQIFDVCKNMQTKGIVTYAISEKVVTNDLARPLVAQFVSLSNSEVSLVILKRVQGNYRCGIRSRTYYNVSEVAKHFGGGGHHNSSGFMIDNLQKLDEIIDFINTHDYK